MVTASTAARIGADKVGSIRISAEDHVASAVDNLGVRIAGSVIQKIVGGTEGSLGVLGGGSSNIIACMQHSIVDDPGIIQELVDSMLDVPDDIGA